MMLQTEYSDKRIQGYGCAVCSVVHEVITAYGIKEFSDKQMNELMYKAYEAGTLTGNCYVMDWGNLGDLVIKVIGKRGHCTLTMLKRSGKDIIQVLCGKPVNGFVMQYDQIDNLGWSHFTGYDYNPDPSLRVSTYPSGIRGLNIDTRR